MRKTITFKQAHATGRNKLSQFEWDFSTCLDHELFECHGYEFAREFPHVREAATIWRRHHHGSAFDDCLTVAKKLSRVDLAPVVGWGLFYFFPEWPEHPYLSISETERHRRLRLLPKLHQPRDVKNALRLIHLPGLLKDYSEPLPSVGKWTRVLPSQERATVKSDDGIHETVALKIDWRHQDGTLNRLFARLLEKLRPNEVNPWPNKGKGRAAEQFRIKLKALGALRLLRIMPWAEAADSTVKLSQGQPLFAEQSNWIRARKDAERYLVEVGG